MKRLAVIGGNKVFCSYLLKLFRLIGVEFNFFTKNDIKYEDYYDYVIVNSNNNTSNILINGSYCLANMDLINFNNKNIEVYADLITYGLGSKNTVTVSSMVDNNSFVYCLQRDISDKVLKVIESQEVPINISFNGDDEIYAAMVAITIGLMEGKDISSFSKGKRLTVFN